MAEQKFNRERKDYYTEKLLDAANKRITRSDNSYSEAFDSEEKYRKMEYDTILSETGGENQDFYAIKNSVSIYDDSETEVLVMHNFSSICLLHKLR